MSDVTRFNCEETFQRLDDYLDRELTAEEMRMVRDHLELCKVCAMEFEFEASVIRQIKHKIQRIDLPPDLLARVSKALDNAADS